MFHFLGSLKFVDIVDVDIYKYLYVCIAVYFVSKIEMDEVLLILYCGGIY